MNLNGKTVVVIGAGSGIGRAVAVDAANAGATLILGGRTAAPLKETARLAGGTVRVVDASREEDVQAFFESIGSFDHLVSTIGTGKNSIAQLGQTSADLAGNAAPVEDPCRALEEVDALPGHQARSCPSAYSPTTNFWLRLTIELR